MRQRRSPCVQHAGHADLRAHAFGIGSDAHHRFRRCFEQQAVDRTLVPIGDVGDLSREREDKVEVLHGQQVICPRGHPVTRSGPLAFGEMPVFARVVCDMLMVTLGAGGHMPAKRLSPAGFNR